MISDSMIAALYSTQGQQIGVSLNGFLFFPFNQGGVIMQDSAGNNWLLTINTDGSLSTQQVTL